MSGEPRYGAATFDESKVARGGDGKFAEKLPAPEAEVVISGISSGDGARRARDVAMVRAGSIIGAHHSDCETVIVEPDRVLYEDGHGREHELSPLTAAHVDRALTGMDRTDPSQWEYYTEGYDEELSEFEWPPGMSVSESGSMLTTRLPVSYMMAGRNDPEDTAAQLERCGQCQGIADGCAYCRDCGVQPIWDADRRQLPPEVSTEAIVPRSYRLMWSQDVEVGQSATVPATSPAFTEFRDPEDSWSENDGAALRSELAASSLKFGGICEPDSRTVSVRLAVRSSGPWRSVHPEVSG